MEAKRLVSLTRNDIVKQIVGLVRIIIILHYTILCYTGVAIEFQTPQVEGRAMEIVTLKHQVKVLEVSKSVV